MVFRIRPLISLVLCLATLLDPRLAAASIPARAAFHLALPFAGQALECRAVYNDGLDEGDASWTRQRTRLLRHRPETRDPLLEREQPSRWEQAVSSPYVQATAAIVGVAVFGGWTFVAAPVIFLALHSNGESARLVLMMSALHAEARSALPMADGVKLVGLLLDSVEDVEKRSRTESNLKTLRTIVSDRLSTTVDDGDRIALTRVLLHIRIEQLRLQVTDRYSRIRGVPTMATYMTWLNALYRQAGEAKSREELTLLDESLKLAADRFLQLTRWLGQLSSRPEDAFRLRLLGIREVAMLESPHYWSQLAARMGAPIAQYPRQRRAPEKDLPADEEAAHTPIAEPDTQEVIADFLQSAESFDVVSLEARFQEAVFQHFEDVAPKSLPAALEKARVGLHDETRTPHPWIVQWNQTAFWVTRPESERQDRLERTTLGAFEGVERLTAFWSARADAVAEQLHWWAVLRTAVALRASRTGDTQAVAKARTDIERLEARAAQMSLPVRAASDEDLATEARHILAEVPPSASLWDVTPESLESYRKTMAALAEEADQIVFEERAALRARLDAQGYRDLAEEASKALTLERLIELEKQAARRTRIAQEKAAADESRNAKAEAAREAVRARASALATRAQVAGHTRLARAAQAAGESLNEAELDRVEGELDELVREAEARRIEADRAEELRLTALEDSRRLRAAEIKKLPDQWLRAEQAVAQERLAAASPRPLLSEDELVALLKEVPAGQPILVTAASSWLPVLPVLLRLTSAETSVILVDNVPAAVLKARLPVEAQDLPETRLRIVSVPSLRLRPTALERLYDSLSTTRQCEVPRERAKAAAAAVAEQFRNGTFEATEPVLIAGQRAGLYLASRVPQDFLARVVQRFLETELHLPLNELPLEDLRQASENEAKHLDLAQFALGAENTSENGVCYWVTAAPAPKRPPQKALLKLGRPADFTPLDSTPAKSEPDVAFGITETPRPFRSWARRDVRVTFANASDQEPLLLQHLRFSRVGEQRPKAAPKPAVRRPTTNSYAWIATFNWRWVRAAAALSFLAVIGGIGVTLYTARRTVEPPAAPLTNPRAMEAQTAADDSISRNFDYSFAAKPSDLQQQQTVLIDAELQRLWTTLRNDAAMFGDAHEDALVLSAKGRRTELSQGERLPWTDIRPIARTHKETRTLEVTDTKLVLNVDLVGVLCQKIEALDRQGQHDLAWQYRRLFQEMIHLAAKLRHDILANPAKQQEVDGLAVRLANSWNLGTETSKFYGRAFMARITELHEAADREFWTGLSRHGLHPRYIEQTLLKDMSDSAREYFHVWAELSGGRPESMDRHQLRMAIILSRLPVGKLLRQGGAGPWQPIWVWPDITPNDFVGRILLQLLQLEQMMARMDIVEGRYVPRSGALPFLTDPAYLFGAPLTPKINGAQNSRPSRRSLAAA